MHSLSVEMRRCSKHKSAIDSQLLDYCNENLSLPKFVGNAVWQKIITMSICLLSGCWYGPV